MIHADGMGMLFGEEVRLSKADKAILYWTSTDPINHLINTAFIDIFAIFSAYYLVDKYVLDQFNVQKLLSTILYF